MATSKPSSSSKADSKSDSKSDKAEDSTATASSTKPTARKSDSAKVTAAKNAVRSASKSSSRPPSKPAGGKGGKGGGSRRTTPVVAARRTPWGLVIATIAVIAFAGVAIGYAVVQLRNKEAKEEAAAASQSAELAAKDPAQIEGVLVKPYDPGQHTQDAVTYTETPPIGGAHDPEWADCTGTVYPTEIRKENAVHSLEHGAVWITYRPDLPQADIDALAAKVTGLEYTMMSPFPGQTKPVSLQTWGLQLQVDTASDPRVDKFIDGARLNPQYVQEQGASCSNPAFKAAPRGPSDAAPVVPGPSDAPVTTPPQG